jgi:hypothetical protein
VSREVERSQVDGRTLVGKGKEVGGEREGKSARE